MGTISKVLVVGLMALCTTAAHAGGATSKESVNLPAEQLAFMDIGGGAKLAAAWGDMNKAAYGTFLRLPAGFDTGMHSHTSDYYGIVISGSITNTETGKKEVPLSAGSYWLQRGKADHATKCVSDSDCVIYITQSSRFDSVPASSKK